MRRLALVVVVLAACAPPFASIYEPDRTVTDVNGAQGNNITRTFTGTGTGVGGGSKQTIDYLDASFSPACHLATQSTTKWGLRVRGTGTQNGAYGGSIIATPGDTWDENHYCSGGKAESGGFVWDRWTIAYTGDGWKTGVDGTRNGVNNRLSRSWIYQAGDDCIQNDDALDGVAIEQDLLESCYGSGISARPSSVIDGTGRVIDVDRSIVHVEDGFPCYNEASYGCPTHGGWLKWEQDPTLAMSVAPRASVWVAGDYPDFGSLALNAPLATLDAAAGDGVNDSCDSNTFAYLGNDSGGTTDFLADVGTWIDAGCTRSTVLTGQAARDYYFDVKADWHTAHDGDLG